MRNKRVIAQVEWPWTKDKKKTAEIKPKRKVSSRIADSMKMKGHSIPMKRLKPITNIVRKPNGEINKRAVNNLIHALEDLLQKEAK